MFSWFIGCLIGSPTSFRFICPALQSNKSETDRRTDQTADQAKNMAENRRKIKISKDYVAEICYYVTGFWSFDVRSNMKSC